MDQSGDSDLDLHEFFWILSVSVVSSRLGHVREAATKEDVEAVSVQDLKPKTYSLSPEHEGKLQSLRIHLPDKIQLYDVDVATAAW